MRPSGHYAWRRVSGMGAALRNGCLASGYTIALPFAPPPSEFFSERVPSLVVTVSECLTELVPDPGLLPRSGVSDVEGTKRMNRAGIALDVVPEMAAAMAAFIDAGDYIFPVFTSLDAALAFKNRFLAALMYAFWASVSPPNSFPATSNDGDRNGNDLETTGTARCHAFAKVSRLRPGVLTSATSPSVRSSPARFIRGCAAASYPTFTNDWVS